MPPKCNQRWGMLSLLLDGAKRAQWHYPVEGESKIEDCI